MTCGITNDGVRLQLGGDGLDYFIEPPEHRCYLSDDGICENCGARWVRFQIVGSVADQAVSGAESVAATSTTTQEPTP